MAASLAPLALGVGLAATFCVPKLNIGALALVSGYGSAFIF